jgi:hypothetical protein
MQTDRTETTHQTTTNNRESSMKMQKAVRIAVVCLVGIGIPLIGQCQTYTLSTPISGFLTMSAWDENSGASGGVTDNFQTLTETIYINPTAQTIEQWGTISGSLSSPNFTCQGIEQLGTFPNPITSVTGNLSVALAPIGGVITFDTGAQPITLSGGAYTFNGNVLALSQFDGSYSLVTGGQTYNGSFNYQLMAQTYYYASHTFNTISTAGYPNSINLSGLGPNGGWWAAPFTAVTEPVTNVAAANGFQMQLSIGSSSLPYAGDVEVFQWSSPGTIAAQEVVPEPSTWALVGLGAIALLGVRRRN